MADSNEIRLASNLTGVAVLDETIGGNDLTQKVVDANLLSVGGMYKSMVYTGADAAIYKNAVVNVTTATAIGDSFSEGGSGDRTGTLPTSVLAFAVKFESQLGSPGPVIVTIGSQIHANLDVGEGVAIPIAGASDIGLAIANVKIHATAYSNGVTEATVTVSVAGV